MIEIENLQKRFGAITAVDGVSFTVERGTVLGFLGPNGAGKSTTMKMLTGFLPPTGGTARIGGHDITTDSLAAKQLVGYLPEGAPLYPDMTPEGFLHFIAEIRGLSGAKAKARVAEVAEKVSLQKVMRQPIETLSKGFKRRVGLAQAILHDPQVLVLDEPTDGLDPNQKKEVRALIRSMQQDKVIILSTHILEEVEALCSRVIIIAGGRIVIDCAPGELAAKSRWHNAVRLELAASEAQRVRGVLAEQYGAEHVETLASETSGTSLLVTTRDRRPILAEISQRAQKDQWKLDGLHVEHGRLDEVFHELTRTGSRN
ncbi:MAG: ATP-binding cassette domain-containing protein [Planctomycetaceae bacterium]|nr:ATP-binding cassette domain-containing protein [Planctomycetaceae bacterium]